MFQTEGVDAVATITELRSHTSELIDRARTTQRGILIQRNGDPSAVLISWDTYLRLKTNDAWEEATER